MKETEKKIEFAKMEGAGNDYIYINCMESSPENPSALSVEVSERHYGIGSDGLVMIMPSVKADFRMRMFNSDGSEAQMCGNATRCIGKYVYEKGLTNKKNLTLETLSGIKHLTLDVADGKVKSVKVDMGIPELKPERIPVVSRNPEIKLSEEEIVEGVVFHITAVSMGNPHAVIFSNSLTDRLVHHYGSLLEVKEIFPERSNIEFVNVTDRSTIEMRVWERGSGETLACGTGACAAVVACVLNNLTDRKVEVRLPGGVLEVEWDEKTGHVFLTGPARFVCEGKYYLR